MSKIDHVVGIKGSNIHCDLLRILSQCDQVYGQLQDWLSMFKEWVAGPMYWSDLSKTSSATDDSDLGKLFPVSFGFPSFIIAETHVLFWTACAVLHSLVLNVHLKVVGETPISQQPTGTRILSSNATICLSHHQELLQESLHSICQSVDYFCREGGGQVGPSTILPSLIVVRAIVASTSPRYMREECWVNEKLRDIQNIGLSFVGSV